ncbi:hypothetical protein V2J09_022918 [Rumex salicifolius]
MVEITSTVGALVPLIKSIPGPSAGAEMEVEREAGDPISAPPAMKEEEHATTATEMAPAKEEEHRGGEDPILELDKEFRCPICMHMIRDAFLTACGHSYCYMCIFTHLRLKRDCPICRQNVAADQIFPNLALDKLLKKIFIHQFAKNANPLEHFCQALRQGCEVSVKDLDSLLSLLVEKKKLMEQDEAEANTQIMLEFLHCLRKRKLEELKQIQSDLLYITEDINAVQSHQTGLYQRNFSVGPRMTAEDMEIARSSGQNSKLPASDFPIICGVIHHLDSSNPNSLKDYVDTPVRSDGLLRHSSFGGTKLDPAQSGSILSRKRRIHTQFNELQEYYLHKRQNWANAKRSGVTDLDGLNVSNFHEDLKDFQSVLTTFTRYSQLMVIAELRQGDLFHSTNVISSIEFDRDDEFFATAGVLRRIKIFEFSSVVKEPAEMHCPIVEMATRSKLSCLSWNKCLKNHIATCDYEGIVTIWDVNSRQSIIEYEEHEKRAWSIDFSRSEPSLLVSGSDDCKVKIWCTNQEESVISINMKANICSVKFNPGSSFYVAAGSADHHIYYYDLRNASQPVHVLSAHKKAVSYVQFMSNNELASASTDGTLRLWDTNKNSLVRTYRGHVNEKNFIGLSVNSEYIACGSETNEVVVYHKAISRPATRHDFSSSETDEADQDKGHFISAVCWKRDSPTIMAANSQGTIKVLTLST